MKYLTAVLLLLTPSFALGVNGNDLLNHCDSNDPSADYNFCLGFVGGISSFYPVEINITWDGYKYCTPKDSTFGQYALVVKKYLLDHPEKLHLAASSLVQTALYEAFPCE